MAASGSGSSRGAISAGYGDHGATHPQAIDATNTRTAASDAPTRSQSRLRMLGGCRCVRGPEPNPRASIDSASWMELSTLVSTTGTATSAHERGPRGRQPRMRWASLTWTYVDPTAGTRFSAAATTAPVRDSAGGSASITSCDASRSENGAAAI